VISPTPGPSSKETKTSLANLFKGSAPIAELIGVKVGDKVVPVAGSHIDIQHDEKQRGHVRYFVNPVNIPVSPENAKTTISATEATKFLQEHFHEAIPKNAVPKLVVENGTGKLKWQFEIPTVPTSGPVTIQIDATDPNGLTDKTAIVIK